ncbi:hypothetical protein AAY42_03525 [Flagellimonas eckloniae]|uniref:Uncharacterized protein n=2 Tax=Flagellimonas eckloniae TaxID=346185 RepID=A0A0Q1DJT7_9FLAO|nr:hypothetical protein AAY42_03525 [Allomuricauda eckloniae]
MLFFGFCTVQYISCPIHYISFFKKGIVAHLCCINQNKSSIKKRTIMNQLSKILAALLLKLLLFILLFGSDSLQGQKKSTSISISNKGKTTISVNNGFGNSFHVEYRGEIKLSDDDSDVVSISPGGYMEIKKSAFGNRRKIFIEPNSSGKLIKKYYVGSSERSFDSEGRKWMAEILLEVVRSTTLGSEQRVNRIYRKTGAYGVLKEIDYIGGDHVKAKYIKLLLQKDLKNADYISILNVIGDDIDSDHHKADILKNNTSKFLKTEASAAAYIEAASEIDSDHHMAEVLKKSIKDGRITDNQMNSLFMIARNIDSDHHKSSVLLTVLKSRSLNSSNLKLLISSAKDIDSDHHRAEVLRAALDTEGVAPSSFHALLSSLDGMSSDYHISTVLSKLLREDLDPSSFSHALKQTGQISSDSHKTSILKSAVKKELSNENIEILIDVLDHMGSDNHKADVYKQLARNSYSDMQLSKILLSIKDISSDYHKADALLAFSRIVKEKGGTVGDSYNSVCRSISSDSHFRRALNAIR